MNPSTPTRRSTTLNPDVDPAAPVNDSTSLRTQFQVKSVERVGTGVKLTCKSVPNNAGQGGSDAGVGPVHTIHIMVEDPESPHALHQDDYFYWDVSRNDMTEADRNLDTLRNPRRAPGAGDTRKGDTGTTSHIPAGIDPERANADLRTPAQLKADSETHAESVDRP
jgi:hypothetical protein